jgi:hypothetical protein
MRHHHHMRHMRPHNFRHSRHSRHVALAVAAAVAVAGVAVGVTVAVHSATAHSAAASTPTSPVATATRSPAGASTPATPSHVYAPYVGVWETTNGHLASVAEAAGVKYLTLAFLQTSKPGSCDAYWNGDSSTPISTSDYGSDIAAIQAAGGNVIPSFGGESADGAGTELADSCDDVGTIAKDYESLATTYHVTRIDLDVEGESLNDTAGITRRNEAIAAAEKWAAANDRTLQFDYTVPVDTTGLNGSSLAVLKSAVSAGADVSVVNLMTFDYYYGSKQDMLTDAEDAATAVYGQLKSLYPGKSEAQLWDMIGVTEMPGIDDYGSDETFTTANATSLLAWAKTKGIGEISVWSLNRDNGNCPESKGEDACSGIDQTEWQFSHTFESFS